MLSLQQSGIHSLIMLHRYNKDFNPHSATNPKPRVIYLATVENGVDSTWYLDNEATNHCTKNFNNLHLETEYKGNK